MSQPAALILAAGYSSRMGAFKPLLTLGDRSAITWCVSAFRDAGISDIRVVTGFGAPELEPELHRLGVVGVPNPNYDRGMFSSIQAGIASLADDIDACFLLPVDTPLVRASTVAALAARRAAAPAPVVNPSFRGQRGHPPLIDKALFAEILAGDGEGGLRALLQRHEAVAVDVVDEAILLDMDTPEDFARLDERAQHRDVPSEAECEAIFERDSVAEPVRRHSRAVASVAAALAQHLDDIDQQVVNAAALLHDIAKGRPDHAEAGATRVASLGYPAVAEAMRHHMDFNFGGRLDAAAVVFVADKLVREDRRVSLDSRFHLAFERFADKPEALAGAQRKYRSACAVLAAIEARAGLNHADLLRTCGVPA